MATETLTIETAVTVYDEGGDVVSETVRTQEVVVDTFERIGFGEGGYSDGPFGGSP